MNDWPDQAKWRRHFEGVIVSGDPAEIEVATEAAVTAVRQGATEWAAIGAGAQAAMRYRNNTAAAQAATIPLASAQAPVQTAERPAWPATLAARLFAIPPRWGWEPATAVAVAAIRTSDRQYASQPEGNSLAECGTSVLQVVRFEA